MTGIWSEIKSSPIAQMALCCMLPVVLIAVLQFAGFSGWWVYPLALFACVGSHLAMSYLSRDGGAKCH